MARTPLYTAIIVTFGRAESLSEVLDTLHAQTVPPSLTVVADNDPGCSAHEVVEQARVGWPGELIYSAVGENLGPAGGWAHAVDVAAPLHDVRGDWVLVIDDDDPLHSPSLVAPLLHQADLQGPRLAAIGLRGARWDSMRARLVRVEPPEGETARVDYLASGGAPLYSWAAIDACGFFDARLFFGFEDLELGFRLASVGWDLVVAPHPSLHVVADTAPLRSEWREYYKTRALTWTIKQHKGSYAQTVSLVRSVAVGGLRLVVSHRQARLAKARLAGAWDGYKGQLGVRRYLPVSNPPKERRASGMP